MPVDPASLDPAAVTVFAGHDLFTLTPCIHDIIRTRYCCPGTIFIVEAIDSAPVSSTGRWQAIRLLVGDGELCMQALLGSAMHRFVEMGELFEGCYIRVNGFELKSCRAPNTDNMGKPSGHSMVYLELDDLTTIGENKGFRALVRERETRHTATATVIGSPKKSDTQINLSANSINSKPSQGLQKDLQLLVDEEDDAEDAFEAFEAMTFPKKKIPSPSPSKIKTARPQNVRFASPSPSKKSTNTVKPPLPIVHARDWHDPQRPLKLTTLGSVPNLPYAQNWSCNVLAIIASLSSVEASYMPPYKQRVARITDPSTSKQVHLTVFLDPEEFTPDVGSAVLLLGVKNHRSDGGSLKKYANDARDSYRGKWWLENPWELGWCDVAGLKQWWAGVHPSQHAQDT